MKARPILMHGRSIRSLLAGRKIQTRRILNPQPPEDTAPIRGPEWFEPEVEGKGGELEPGAPVFGIYDEEGEWGMKCLKGAPGDLLYVRETFGCLCHNSMQPCSGCELVYRATYGEGEDYPLSGWRPSIHMPRWASRLTLHLTGVYVERVQEISEDDAMDEGIEFEGDQPSPRYWFSKLWDDTNGPGAWDRNQWVWVLCFDVIEANVDDVLAGPARYGIGEVA